MRLLNTSEVRLANKVLGMGNFLHSDFVALSAQPPGIPGATAKRGRGSGTEAGVRNTTLLGLNEPRWRVCPSRLRCLSV